MMRKRSLLVSIIPRFVEALPKQADPRPRRSRHFGEFFMGNLQFDANAVRVFLFLVT
jgi:hypothetical protein